MARRRRGAGTVLLAALAASGTAGLASPFLPDAVSWVLLGAGLVFTLLTASPRLLMACGLAPALLGNLEWAAAGGLRAGWLAEERPLLTVLGQGAGANPAIIPDAYRVFDPLLLWRPVPYGPYTAQRLRGPIAVIPKPAGVYRILCCGDSFTDGGLAGSWPQELQRLLAQRADRVEVLNAGVAGYTSRQGLLRFREDAARFQPDLVITCFGWNDPMACHGRPDAEFPVPSPAWTAVQRGLLRYRTTLCLRHLLSTETPLSHPGSDPSRPRVDPEAFLGNLQGFLDEAEAVGARVAFMTRPYHRGRVAAMDPAWERRVPPLYNGRLRLLAEPPLLDADAFLAGRQDLFADWCHLTPDGHRILAAWALSELAAKGLLPPPPTTR